MNIRLPPMDGYHYLTIERHDEGRIVRILLDRPETRNAQNRGLLVELDAAFRTAEADDEVRVVILGGTGSVFSSGHDLGSKAALSEQVRGPDQHVTFRSQGATRQGAERRMLQEWHHYYANARRWRELRKITIAQVHGPVYAGALILAWACDLIVAAEGTTFADVVGTRLGMCGAEYFAHPWEWGQRKAKELLLTGDCIDANEAYRLGMVSKVFDRDELAERTLDFARRISLLPTMTSLLIKDSVNQTVDSMGFHNSLQACFSLHELNHSHWAEIHADSTPLALPEDGVPDWRTGAAASPAHKHTP